LPDTKPELAERQEGQGLTTHGGITDAFVVLDVNGRFAAVKRVYHFEDGHGERDAVDCGYSGMEQHPTSGVQLALMALATGAVQHFDVYETATTEAGMPEWMGPPEMDECTPEKTAAERLAQAKKAFEEAGLDINRRPEPDVRVVEPKGVLIEESQDEAQEDTGYQWSVERRSSPVMENRTLQLHSVNRIGSDEDPLTGVVTLELRDADRVYYRAVRDYALNMAGSGDISIPMGYRTPEGVVFVELFHWFSAMMGSGSNEHYGMTPPIPLAR